MLRRTLTPELMDDPALERVPHWWALAGLERINRWSRSAALLWPALAALAVEKQRPIRVLDIATGAGDVPRALAARATRESLPLRFDACDISADALAYARDRAGEANVTFFQLDVLHDNLPDGYDAVMSSLFLHHLEDTQALTLLQQMADAADLVLVNDLRRCRAGWWLAYLGTRVLSRSPVVHVDGPRSVERAFSVSEVQELAQEAGLTGAVVERRWPCRWLLTWRKPPGWVRRG